MLFIHALCGPVAFAQSSAPRSIAEDYIRASFTVESGLPDNVVNDTVQTSNGLLWFGTDAGLATFDGREFTRVNLRSLGAVALGAVHMLATMPNGDLWVGSDAGLVRIADAASLHFEPSRLTIYDLGVQASERASALHVDRRGTL